MSEPLPGCLDEETRAKRQAARLRTVRAIKDGTLKPEPCERCGERKVHAHHEDYDKPLEIMWLCQLCHAQRHRETGTGPRGGKRPGAGRRPSRGKAATRRVTVSLTRAEADELRAVAGNEPLSSLLRDGGLMLVRGRKER